MTLFVEKLRKINFKILKKIFEKKFAQIICSKGSTAIASQLTKTFSPKWTQVEHQSGLLVAD